MRKTQNDKKTSLTTSSNSVKAYTKAQQLLEDLKQGYVNYDKIYTSGEEAQAAFTEIISGELLYIVGNSFYWKHQPGDALILYGRKAETKTKGEKGLVEICRLRVPDEWVGVGRFTIDWPKMEVSEDITSFLITLYLYSINPMDLKSLIPNENINAAFLACIFLEKENARLFAELAEDRYTPLV